MDLPEIAFLGGPVFSIPAFSDCFLAPVFGAVERFFLVIAINLQKVRSFSYLPLGNSNDALQTRIDVLH